MAHNPKIKIGHEGNPYGTWSFDGGKTLFVGSNCSCGAKFLAHAYSSMIQPHWLKKGERMIQADPDDWRPWDEIVKEHNNKEPKRYE